MRKTNAMIAATASMMMSASPAANVRVTIDDKPKPTPKKKVKAKPAPRHGQGTAHLSRYHPDYGLTMAEHLKNKAARAAGKEKFVSKDSIRRKRRGY